MSAKEEGGPYQMTWKRPWPFWRPICWAVGHDIKKWVELEPRPGPAPRPVEYAICERCGKDLPPNAIKFEPDMDEYPFPDWEELEDVE